MRFLNTLLFLSLSVAAFGQSIPYTVLKTLDECAKEFRQIEGFTAELTIKHLDPKDSRDFQVWLETSKGRKQIKINKDGTFRLPAVKADEQAKAQIVHSLEKGALDLGFSFNWAAKTGRNMNGYSNLFEFCSVGATSYARAERLFIKVSDVIPAFRDMPITIVGVSLKRDVPCSGLAVLKNGDKTVASVDLSQTGEVSWMFSDYDPRTHRVVYEMKNGAAEPYLNFDMRMDSEAAGSKGAIVLRKPK
ncbi:MAG TPA: hypothetical protein VFZ59_13135 [Verrucomicrobiae bacterium]|nr:hypothetical protein [Verrucomicrobiae bacterium]